MKVAQLTLENLAAGLARQRVEELDVSRHLEIGEASAQERLHRGRRQHGLRLRLDAGKQPLAEFVVGDAEHRAVADAVHADQYILDFGGIDVDAARDHHVALAVAQEQIAVRVEIADVADADEAIAAGLGPGSGVAVIVEIGNRGLPHEDLAGLVDFAKRAVGPEYFGDAALDHTADS